MDERSERLFKVDDMSEECDWNRLAPTERFKEMTDVHGSDVNTLLDLSLKKWQFLLEEMELTGWPVRDGGPTTCALCSSFNMIGGQGYCSTLCPIKADTGRDACADTPYDDWHDFEKLRWIKHTDAIGFPGNAVVGEMIDVARREVAYLERLKEGLCSSLSHGE